MELEWTWNDSELNLKWIWNGPQQILEWIWNGSGMIQGRFWNESEMDLEWTWAGSEMNVKWNSESFHVKKSILFFNICYVVLMSSTGLQLQWTDIEWMTNNVQQVYTSRKSLISAQSGGGGAIRSLPFLISDQVFFSQNYPTVPLMKRPMADQEIRSLMADQEKLQNITSCTIWLSFGWFRTFQLDN